MSNLDVVRGLIGKRENLAELLDKYIPKAFPVGMVVHWEHGNHTRSGVIDMHSRWRGSEVRVELQTGSTKWIAVTTLLEYSQNKVVTS